MKKGFTLVEIIAVVVILGILSLVGTVAISGILKTNRDKAYQNQIKYIEKGAASWAGKNVFLLPDGEEETLTLTLWFLKQEGFVKNDIKNPQTEILFPNDLLITITKKNNNYVYEVLENTGTEGLTGSYNTNAPLIILIGKAKETIVGNSTETGYYNDPGVIAKTKAGEIIKTIDIVITENGNVVSSIPLNKSSKYIITYKVVDNHLESVITREVTITI